MDLNHYRKIVHSDLFLNGPVVIFIWAENNGWPVESVSPNITRLYGYETDEFQSGTLAYADIIHPDDRKGVKQEVKNARLGTAPFFEHRPYRIRTKAGEYRWVQDTTVLLRRGETVTHYVGYLIDITARHQLQGALEESTRRWSYAIEGNGDGLWDWDIESNEVYFSPQWKRMLGFADDEIGNSLEEWEKRVHPDDLEGVYAEIQKHINGEKNGYVSEHRVLCKDGSYKWVLDRGVIMERTPEGKPKRMIGTHSDISQRKAVEEALESANTLHRTILENIHYAVITGTPEGTITSFNKEAEKMLGYTADELIGKETPGLFHDRDEVIRRAVEFSRELGRTIEPGFEVFVAKTAAGLPNEHEWTYISKAGERIPVLLSISALKDADGTTTGYVGIARDISEEKETRTRLIDSRKMLNNAQHIAKVGSWSLELKTNRLEWSDEIFRIFEIDKEQFEPSYEGFLGAIHPDDIDVVNDAFAKSVADKTPYSISHRLLMKDGRVKYVIENGMTTYDEAGEPLLSEGTVQDITEFKELEIAYLNEHRFLGTLIDNAESVITAIDRNGVMVELNRYGCEFVGYTQEEIAAEPYFWERFLPPAIRPEIRKIIEGAKKGEIEHRYENPWISRYGEERVFEWSSSLIKDENGEMEYVIAIGVDVTGKKALEKELEIHNEELETILETTKDGIAILDMETRFLFFNSAYLRMTGFSEAELRTKHKTDLSAPEDRAGTLAVLEEVRKKGFVENFEKTTIVKGGRRVKVNMSIALMPDGKRFLVTTRDVTRAKRLEKKMKDYVGLVDEYIITSSTDLDGNITAVSRAFCRISGYDEAELLGKNHRIIRHPDMPESLYEEMWNAIIHNNTWEGEIKNRAKDGSSYWVQAAISPVWDEEGKKTGYTAIRQDITDKKRVEELSVTDRLTGLYNRMKLDEVFTYELERSRRYETPMAIIILDLDHFKSVNDTHGHHVGDQVLQDLADVLRDGERASDTLGRWGGEEFLIILPETDFDGALQRAELICKAIAAHPFPVVGTKTASLGVTAYREGDTETSLLERADDALYRAKENGRNRVEGSR